MIVWVFFEAGAGGDGFANLLEHSLNVVSIDGEKQWRVHRYVDSKVKFWAPNLQNIYSQRINTDDQLTDQQVEIANSDNQYLIITSHDVGLTHTFLSNKISKEKHIKLLLESADQDDNLKNYIIKNLINADLQSLKNNRTLARKPAANYAKMDFRVQLDNVLNSWEYTQQLAKDIGLQLMYKDFEHYTKIVSGEIEYTIQGLEKYKSSVGVDNLLVYTKIN
jgi:hypothetical protein